MPPISKWDAVVREIQHETGLPDDAFLEASDGALVVSGSGYAGDLTREEMDGVVAVAESRGFVVYQRDGAARIVDPRDGDPGGAPSDFDFTGGGV